MLLLLVASVALAAAIGGGNAYANPATSSAPSAEMALPTVTVATADVEATATPGDGVIRITTRVCGSAVGWESVAAANAITPPTYLVLLGQRLTVSCPGNSPAGTTAQPEPVSPNAAGWANPLPGACVSDTYGWHDWRGYVHQGLDLAAGDGTPVYAAAGGQVTRSGWVWSGYGISVTIAYGDDWTTHYAHLSRAAVSVGQWVGAGALIGYVGQTGQVTGPHLHFEIASRPSVLGSQIDPQPVMAARGVRWGEC